MNKKMCAIKANEIIVAKNLNELRNKLLSNTYHFFTSYVSDNTIIIDYRGKKNLFCYFHWGLPNCPLPEINHVFLHGESDDAEQDMLLDMLGRCIDISYDKFIKREAKHWRGPQMDYIYANDIDEALNQILAKSNADIQEECKGEDVLLALSGEGYCINKDFNPNRQINGLDVVSKMKVENGAMCISA